MGQKHNKPKTLEKHWRNIGAIKYPDSFYLPKTQKKHRKNIEKTLVYISQTKNIKKTWAGNIKQQKHRNNIGKTLKKHRCSEKARK